MREARREHVQRAVAGAEAGAVAVACAATPTRHRHRPHVRDGGAHERGTRRDVCANASAQQCTQRTSAVHRVLVVKVPRHAIGVVVVVALACTKAPTLTVIAMPHAASQQHAESEGITRGSMPPDTGRAPVAACCTMAR